MSKVPPEKAHGGRRRLRLSLYNELTEDHIWKFHFSKAGLTVAILSVIVALSLLIYALIAYTPVRTLIPGYPDEHSRLMAASNATLIDSLEYEIRKWDLYSENLRRVLSGEETLPLDSLYAQLSDRSASPASDLQQDALRREEASLREDVRRAQAQDSSPDAVLESLDFYAPVAGGEVTAAFDPDTRSGIEVTVPSGTDVCSVLDGTIIQTVLDGEFGYVLMIQHENDLVSVYRLAGSLIRHGGDAVRAGTPIALTGSAPEEDASAGIPVMIELWHSGEPVDPARFIRF